MKKENICLNCGHKTHNPKFCSRNCAATINNKLSPKRQPENNCVNCNKQIKTINKYCKDCRPTNNKDVTLGEVIYNTHHKSSAFALVRSRARNVLKKTAPHKCVNCGYDKHIEACHRIAIAKFSSDTKLSVINDPTNLIALCPNCHWEFDNGFLSF